MSAGTTTTTLRGLQPDTLYTVTLVPVYAAGDGKRMSENGKTSKTKTPLGIFLGIRTTTKNLRPCRDLFTQSPSSLIHHINFKPFRGRVQFYQEAL